MLFRSRYRKDNGRISSDVEDYESRIGVLDEKDEKAQEILAKFLSDKDPKKTISLIKSLLHEGQREPAIITCDGFLINGNRRKMAIESLHEEFPGDDNFLYMKVVILPGKGRKEGGAPTLFEIERIENRYELQSDGKAEYYGLDRALSIRRKDKIGLTLEMQLTDDPRYVKASKGDLKTAVKKYTDDYLDPLECVDRYLRQFDREGQYKTISSGMTDSMGRWYAFVDYAKMYRNLFLNPNKLDEIGIKEEEVGLIETAAFNIIRLRTMKDIGKVHNVMRDLGRYCKDKRSEEHTSELQSHSFISYAVFCLKKKKQQTKKKSKN